MIDVKLLRETANAFEGRDHGGDMSPDDVLELLDRLEAAERERDERKAQAEGGKAMSGCLENTIREVLRSGQSKSHRTADGTRLDFHQYSSAKVDALLALLDRLQPGILQRAKALTPFEKDKIRKEIDRLESQPGRYNRERTAQLKDILRRQAEGGEKPYDN